VRILEEVHGRDCSLASSKLCVYRIRGVEIPNSCFHRGLAVTGLPQWLPKDPMEPVTRYGDMRSPDQYRKSAAHCWRLAQAAKGQTYRALLLSFAGTYVALADQMEELGNVPAPENADLTTNSPA
jgi:hypothetical protein